MYIDTPPNMIQNNDSILDRYGFPPGPLLKRCPLDYNNSTPIPTDMLNDLGTLEQFPAELQLKIFANLDLKTFLAFRTMCRKARALTNSVQEFCKIMQHGDTASVIRMAVGIDVAHRHTVEEVFRTLCQDTCNSVDCTKLAPYVDVFLLRRLCLGCGIGCRIEHAAQTAYDIKTNYGLNDTQVASLPSFRPITKVYGTFVDLNPEGRDDHKWLYDGISASQLSSVARDANITCQRNRRLTLVRASLLDRTYSSAQAFFSYCRCTLRPKYNIDVANCWYAQHARWQPILEYDPEEYGITICLGKTYAQHLDDVREGKNLVGKDV